mgnify:FL=1
MIILVFMTALTMTISVSAQTDKASIEQTIHQFVKATTDRDVHGMHYLLHEKFQSVEKPNILSKSEYMKLLGDRKIGGSAQKAEILFIDLTENSASLKVRFSVGGETTESFVHLYKNDLGSWQILHVLPYSHQKV